MTPADLLALPGRELDARVAEGYLGLRIDPQYMNHPQYPYRMLDKDGRHRFAPGFCNPKSPRSLLDGVEAEIERRNLWFEYAAALITLMRPDGDWATLSNWHIAWIAATAPTKVRAAAAVAVMAGKNARL
jgi:hypothetical protein